MTHIYDQGLEKNSANYTPLSPISLLRRTADVYPDRLAVAYQNVRRSWSEVASRCRQLASALERLGIQEKDTVSVLAPNVPELLECHFGVLMAKAVLNALNVRLDPPMIAFILRHSEAKCLIVDRSLAEMARQALEMLGHDLPVITIDDPAVTEGPVLGSVYEDFISAGSADHPWWLPEDEWQSCCLNYTSGTTGNPKGVVYSHRGAYLNAIGNTVTWDLPRHMVYLWTLPMFHCNGWCFPWTVTAKAGTHVCLRQVQAKPIYDALADHAVTHFCGAPIIMGMLSNAPEDQRRALPHRVQMMTAGAAPPAAVLEATEAIGFDVTHVYGLTEVYGPAAVCDWHDEWDDLPVAARAAKKAQQGVRYVMQEDMIVADPKTLKPVPLDGNTIGEVMFRGNITMKGYLKNPNATAEAFAGGFFRTGDLAVCHPDGYIEIRDRSKDIIISGGENISTIEVEGVLHRHPAIMEVAVVAQPDPKWGETPCAFVFLKPGMQASEAELIAFCRDNLAHFKCPRRFVFGELPKTSTGKVQKYTLRDHAKSNPSD